MFVIDIVKHSLLITGFVFIMMLLIEYINVQTHGQWQRTFLKSRFKQYLLAAFLGVIPGCLGAFSVVSLYSHRVLSFGALVAAMIATSGDAAYVMLSLFPLKTLLLNAILFALAILSGYLVDVLYKKQDALLVAVKHNYEIHEKEICHCLTSSKILPQLKNISFPRALLIAFFSLFLFGLITEIIGPQSWNWVKVTLLISALFALFVVSTVPDHFLEEHLWEHVLKKHLLNIFLWTFGALLVIHLLEHYLDLNDWIQSNLFTILILAVLVGIIPESGPHLIFVTLFASGSIPFSILLASSIVQDGHGTLPLLAVSNRGFVYLKIINVAVGFLIGALGLLIGF
ncbi:putative manganese transporter [Calditrichota bacterium GD2]